MYYVKKHTSRLQRSSNVARDVRSSCSILNQYAQQCLVIARVHLEPAATNFRSNGHLWLPTYDAGEYMPQTQQ